MYAYKRDAEAPEGVDAPSKGGTVDVAERGGSWVRVAVGVDVAPTCTAFLNPDWSANAFAWTTKMPIEPGIPIPSNRRVAKMDCRLLARMNSYLFASWLVTLFHVCDGTAGGMAL
jgi:hypothetical protein